MTYVLCPSCGRMWETTKTWFDKCPKCGKRIFVPTNKVTPPTTTSSTTKTSTKPPTTKPVTTTPNTTNTVTTTLPPIAHIRKHSSKPSKKRLS